jgi:inner membrane protein involved in colicin E2 resistance
VLLLKGGIHLWQVLNSGLFVFLLNNLKRIELNNIKPQSVLSVEHILINNFAIVNVVVLKKVQFVYADERFPKYSYLIIVGLIYFKFYLFTSSELGKNASF